MRRWQAGESKEMRTGRQREKRRKKVVRVMGRGKDKKIFLFLVSLVLFLCIFLLSLPPSLSLFTPVSSTFPHFSFSHHCLPCSPPALSSSFHLFLISPPHPQSVSIFLSPRSSHLSLLLFSIFSFSLPAPYHLTHIYQLVPLCQTQC